MITTINEFKKQLTKKDGCKCGDSKCKCVDSNTELDKINHEDADINNDDIINDEDSYLINRRKVIAAAIADKENKK